MIIPIPTTTSIDDQEAVASRQAKHGVQVLVQDPTCEVDRSIYRNLLDRIRQGRRLSGSQVLEKGNLNWSAGPRMLMDHLRS